MDALITIEEALRLVLERAKPLEAERVPIERAFGRVLAEPATAACDLPPFPSSAMDGYALRATDTAGAVQPLDQPWNLQGMRNNMVQRVEVVVE